ncbi:cytochrome P450 [Paenibacillus sambharensis]|uniref:Cytochrome P450 n=1 Tax=Paenibacillus sambharensis TaxID=1803190 RepID=A0A2W1LQ73_9BACL|nr:cytochrome P450 [Paenibacillus sambharensis]PZD96995.1 cytochrome P450 [Paenibacillus sambharensis]
MRKTGNTVPGPRPIPILGNFLDLGSNPLKFFSTCTDKYGPVIKLTLEKDRDMYILSRPEDIRYVLVNTQKQFKKGYQRDPILKLVLGNGLITSEGEFWLRQRRLTQPAFHQHRINSYAEAMTHSASRMLEGWRDGEIRDIHQDMMQCTMEIVARTLFNVDLTASEDAKTVGRALDQVLHQYVKQSTSVSRRLLEMLPVQLPLRGHSELKQSVEELDRIIYTIIDQRRQQENQDHGDLLSMLLLARDDDGSGMTDEQLRDEVMSLFLAGHETTANALSWSLYALGQHPAAYQKLTDELDEVLNGRLPGLQDIPSLVYTQSIIKESMRLYPPVWMISREALTDVELEGYTLPAGCEVALSQWIMHRHPGYYAEPESFHPDRWTSEFESNLPSYAYFPFGAGPRVCIGSNFAMMEAVLLLAAVAQSYKLELLPEHTVVLEPSITLRPRDGMKVRLSAR